MPTRLEILADSLDLDMSRRRRELSDMKLLASATAGAKASAIRRAGHVMAYSHWEGFVKNTLKAHLKYICESRVLVGTLKEELRIVQLTPLIRSAGNEEAFAMAMKVYKAINQHESDVFDFQADYAMKTGNLTSGKLKALLQMCALDYTSQYQKRENFIDEVLCGRRHRIAHGGMEPVTETDLIEAIDGVLELCDAINSQVVESLLYSTYFAPQN